MRPLFAALPFLILGLLPPVLSPAVAQSSREEAVVDMYRFLLQPKTRLVDTLLGRDQEFFFGADTALSFESDVPFDGIYALFAADRYNWERVNVSGYWYAGFYARQAKLITSQIPLAFTVGWTMRLPGRKLTSWAFDWTWFGLTDDPEDNRNYLSLGLWGLRYGIGFRDAFTVEYHTWGVYDLDVLVGWLSAFLKWDTATGNTYTDIELLNIRINRYLAFSVAVLLQMLSEGRLNADYWYLWPSLELNVQDNEAAAVSLFGAGGVVHKEGEYRWGFSVGVDFVKKKPGPLPVWLRVGLGVNDREAGDRLRNSGLVTMQLTLGLLWDAPDKEPAPGERKRPFWERIEIRKKEKSPPEENPPPDPETEADEALGDLEESLP